MKKSGTLSQKSEAFRFGRFKCSYFELYVLFKKQFFDFRKKLLIYLNKGLCY